MLTFSLLRVFYICQTVVGATETQQRGLPMKYDSVSALERAGIRYRDAVDLRRISMTLHRWHELECGIDNGCVERDETTGKTYWLNSYSGRRTPIADRETGAIKRLRAIMSRY